MHASSLKRNLILAVMRPVCAKFSIQPGGKDRMYANWRLLMRVAYISADSGVPIFGCKGCSIHAQEILRALLAHGADVHLFASNLGGKPLPGLEKVHTIELPYRNEHSLEMRELVSLAINRDLRSVLKQSPPFDLIYERY